MRPNRILIGLLLGLPGTLFAQSNAPLLVAPAPVHHGTYSVDTGIVTPSLVDGMAVCGAGVIYNNSVPDPTFGQLGYFHNAAAGNTILDEGRIPSISGGGPADIYEVQGFTIGYATNQPRVNVQISIWKDGDTCDTLAQLGTPTTQCNFLRLPGSPNGQLTAVTVDIDLCDKAFEICGDSNAIFGDGDWDKFVWGFKVLGQDPGQGDQTGPLIAGDPQGCARGVGLFGPLGGFGSYLDMGCDSVVEGDATGLGTDDSFRRAGDGPLMEDCFWFGGYPANPFASFFLKLHSSSINDSCESATELRASIGPNVVSCNTCCSNSTEAGCNGYTSPSLWYSWVAPAAGSYIFDTCGSSFDTAITVWSGACGALVCEAGNDDFCGLQSSVTVPLAQFQLVYIQVQGFGASSCGDFLLNIEPDPCTTVVDDALGDNDVCTDAIPVTDGTSYIDYSFDGDDDWYCAGVCPGETITFDTFFIDADGDIDITLYDTMGGCPGNLLTSSTSASDNEQVSFTNTGTEPMRVCLEVTMFTNGACNEYTLEVTGDCTLGTVYCGESMQLPNSTGTFGKLDLYGSLIAANDDLNMVARDLPANQFGFFVWSTSSAFINLPASGVSDGVYCLGSGQGRFHGLNGDQGAILPTGAGGTFSLLMVDTTAMPQSSMVGNLAITAGLTGYFQAWYRDITPAGNNFTDARSLTWQ